MTNAIARFHRLVPRGGPGLPCDDDGLALGPVTLAKAVRGLRPLIARRSI